VLPKAIHQFLLITANISKKAVIETALMLSPQSRIGELIQERNRIIMVVEVEHKASVWAIAYDETSAQFLNRPARREAPRWH
jgi:hypothetical protein